MAKRILHVARPEQSSYYLFSRAQHDCNSAEADSFWVFGFCAALWHRHTGFRLPVGTMATVPIEITVKRITRTRKARRATGE